MAVNIQRLRTWFALAAVAVVLVVALFYGYGRWQASQEVARAPRGPLDEGVQQAAEGFTLSRSEGGRTLFTVRASQAIQFREGGRAQLKDVNIIIYGRREDRFDQIYGADFLYDPETSDITARGEVHIDLEAHAEGAERPEQGPPRELKNPIHLKTSGLVFNHQTGLAATKEEIEFRFPQAGGTAQGATYDSRSNVLTLQSQVQVETRGDDAATLTARRAVVTAGDRRVELEAAAVKRGERHFASERMTVLLRPDNSVERMVAEGNVRAGQGGAAPAAVRAAQAEFRFQEAARNLLRDIVLGGGVQFSSAGEQPLDGQSQRMVLEFAAPNQLTRARALDGVQLQQKPAQAGGQAVELQSEAVEFSFAERQALQRATTSGQAQIVLTGAEAPLATRAAAAAGPTRTVVTAGRFQADFARGQLRRLHGAPQARVVSSTPGQPDRVSSSREITLQFAPTGAIGTLAQTGDFRYREGERTATAAQARYDAVREVLLLSGEPRVVDGPLTATAGSIRLQRRTGDAIAEGDVKTTYAAAAAPAAGALLGAAEPIHATAPRVHLRAGATGARYSGGARLWQGANIVQAPTMEFERERRSVVAQGTPGQPVTTVFLQPDAKGEPAPINVTAARLSYTDEQRRARFEGGVVARGADATMTAAQVDIFLRAEPAKPQPAAQDPSQVERIVASGGVVIQQLTRRATGERLVYTSEDGKFVLSGGSPSIFDAEHGTIRGDSLTFFSRDDRVLVGSGNSSRAVIQTRVRD